VVRTWGELARQPAIKIGGGITVRLGLSADHCPLNSGVLIYCLSEGYDALRTHETNTDRLGPLWVNVTCGGQSFVEPTTITSLSRWGYLTTRNCSVFFRRPVLIDRAGNFEVKVRSDRGDVIANATIKGGGGDAYHPWTPFHLEKEGEWEWISRDKYSFRQTAPAVVSVSGIGRAVPERLGDQFGVYEGRAVLTGKAIAQIFKPKGAAEVLPQLVPEQIDPSLTLSMKEDLVLLDSEDGVETSRPDWHLLARWWVNGKPFIPATGHAPEHEGGGTVHWGNPLQFRLKLDPRKIGAQPGDRVRLQLLLCDSWNYVENPAHTMGTGGEAHLTNAVEFVVK
jgi:hypothetical protein